MKIPKVLIIAFFILFHANCKSIGKLSDSLSGNILCDKLQQGFYHKSDSNHRVPLGFEDYKSRSFKHYCKNSILGSKVVGNPKKLGKEIPWTQNHGSSVKLANFDQTKYKPGFVKFIQYRKVGACTLGMNIYINDLENLKKKNLKPFLFIHGGAWQYRGFTSSAAVESYVSLLISHGYAVFSPFYRLLGNSVGPEECRNAGGNEIQEDMKAAFAWVNAHRQKYGIDQSKMSVGGQSAGGHLALFLLTEYPDLIDHGLLLYPPTDFMYMIEAVKNKGYPHLAKNNVIGNYVYGKDPTLEKSLFRLENLDPNHLIVQRNSFPQMIEKNPGKYPPIFLIHGKRDRIVPVSQSLRLCHAYGGPSAQEILASKKNDGKHIECGSRSVMYLFEQGRHMLDLRCVQPQLKGIIPSSLGNSLLCAAGSGNEAGKFKTVIENYTRMFLDPSS